MPKVIPIYSSLTGQEIVLYSYDELRPKPASPRPSCPRAGAARAIAERCQPWPEKAALVFVERALIAGPRKSPGLASVKVHLWYYFPEEGAIVGKCSDQWGEDGSLPVFPGDTLDQLRDRKSPANYRFLDRVTFAPPRGKAPGHFRCTRFPLAMLWWDECRALGSWFSFPGFCDVWRVTPGQVEKLLANCEPREFNFDALDREERRAKAKPGARGRQARPRK